MGRGCANLGIVIISVLKLAYGLLILGVAMSMVLKNVQHEEFKNNPKMKPRVYYGIAVGIIAIVTSLFGFLGGILETTFFLVIYIILLIAQLAVDLTAAIYALTTFREDLKGIFAIIFAIPVMVCLEMIEIWLAVYLLWHLRRSLAPAVYYSDPYALYPFNYPGFRPGVRRRHELSPY